MYASSLSSITSEYIKSITNNGVYSRGVSYFKSGRVLNLKYRDGELTAAVSGSEPFPYEVSIYADEEEIYDMDCTCLYASDGEICKHIVATLLQWIENRNKKNAYKPLLPRKPKFLVIINYSLNTPICCIYEEILISKLSRDVQTNHLHESVY